MTILAQPNDCHSCNDARSIVQKKLVQKKNKLSWLVVNSEIDGADHHIDALLFTGRPNDSQCDILVRCTFIDTGSGMVSLSLTHSTVNLNLFLTRCCLIFLP